MALVGSKEEQHATLTTADNQIYRGILNSKDENIGKIVLKNVTVNNTKLPGLHNFYASNIKELTLSNGLQDWDNITNKTTRKGKRIGQKLGHHRKDRPRHLEGLPRFDSDQLIRSPCNCVGDNDSGDQGIGSAEENESFEDCYQMDNFILFCRTTDKFRSSITYLMAQDAIAVTFFGVDIGRGGTLSLIQVATEKDILMYDILRLGSEGFVDGLQAVFESKDVIKVIHDCRMASDLLYHQFDVTLENVFDTQVAGVFVFRLLSGGDWPRFVDNLPATLIAHLGLKSEDVHHFFVRERLKQKDEEVWLHRPLCSQLLQDSLKNLVHMMPLYHTLLAKMMTEFHMGVQLYLDHVRSAPQDGVDKFRSFSHLLPFVFQDLPKLAAHSAKDNTCGYRRGRPSYDSNGFVETCQIKGNTMVVTSRDGIWQRNSYFSPASKCDTKTSVPGSKDTKNVTHSSCTAHEEHQLCREDVDSWKNDTRVRDEPKRGIIHEKTNRLESAPLDLKSTPTTSLRQKSEQRFSLSPSKLNDRLLQIETPERQRGNASSIDDFISPSAVERSALMRLIPPSCSSSSTCSEILSDPEIVDQRQGPVPSAQGDWDMDKVLEFEMAQRILKQARLGHSKSETKRRMLPSKLKQSPKPENGC